MAVKKKRASIKSTIVFDAPFWVAIFERFSEDGYSVAKHVFGDEPSSPDFYDFILKDMDSLRFTAPQKEEIVLIKKKNPKRLQRDAKKEMKSNGQYTVSKAHEAMKKEQEKNKKEKKRITREEREMEENKKFLLKQEKRKQKHRGR